MLPKRKRVTKELFSIIMKRSKVAHGSFFVFRYIDQENPQYAFVAPKNIAKGAVERNKLRRRGYALFHSYAVKNKAGIFFYKKEARHASPQDIKKDIQTILVKSNII